MKRFILILALLLEACAPTKEMSALQSQADRPMYCAGKNDCDVKWGRALSWVQRNSEYQMESASDMMIKTKGPLPYDAHAAYTVTKVPEGKGRYKFTFAAYSGNLFGCIPACTQQAAMFNAYVMKGRE